jgi:hypothetical protein
MNPLTQTGPRGAGPALALGLFALLVLGTWPPAAPAPAQEARAADPLAALNDAFRQTYAGSRARLLAGTRPVILFDGDKLVLLRASGRAEAEVAPALYATLKSASHVPLAVYLLLAGADGELDEKALAGLRQYRELVLPARDDLKKRGLTPAQLERQQRLLDESRAFLDGVLERKKSRRDDVIGFARKVRPLILENVDDAARSQIDALHARVTAWKKEMPAEEWKRLRVVVQGSHMPRVGNLATQYFAWALGGDVDERRLIYTEGIFDEERSLSVLGTSLQDSGIAEAFFGEPLRMHRDLLADAAAAYLKKLPREP